MVTIERVLVVGAGPMGAQIAMVCALNGFETTVCDIDDSALGRARHALEERTARSVEKGRLSAVERETALGRLSFGTDITGPAMRADFVIEAAVERLDVKRKLFAELDRLAPPHAVLATNSSGFVPSQLADATRRPEKLCNLHFFNPALVMRCVEVVRGPQTSDETVQTAVMLAERLGKLPVVLEKEIPGFVANRILNAVRDEAIYLLESGVASVEAIDTVCRSALGYPMGPFELMDLTGIDIGYRTKKALYDLSGDPKDLPSRSVAGLVERGELGRKTGKGWYAYDRHGNKSEGASWTSR